MKHQNKIMLGLIYVFFLFCVGTANAAGWTLTNIGGGNGYVIEPSDRVSGANFDLYGSNIGSYLYSTTLYTTTVGDDSETVISWYYQTLDSWGPYWDPAGYYINGEYTPLTNNSDALQSGTVTISLHAGDVAGFYVTSVDNLSGGGILTISGIPADNNQMPEPTSMLLLGLGLIGLAGIKRKFKK